MQLRTEQRPTSRPSSPEVESLEAQVGQLQSRLMYMEEEKARLVAAAKGKNEQVRVITCRLYVCYRPLRLLYWL